MRYAIIDGGLVANVALADAEFAEAQGWTACPGEVGPGWSFAGGVFTPPAPPAPTVPQTVTMRQAQLALLAAGHFAAVETLIASMPSPQREAAQIEWRRASECRRDSPLVAAIGGALGLDEEAKDALFINAAAL